MYVPVSQRKAVAKKGYVPVAQRQAQAPVSKFSLQAPQSTQPLVGFEAPKFSESSSQKVPSIVGGLKGVGEVAKTFGREFVRQPASIGVEISNRLNKLMGKPQIEQLGPEDFAKVPGLSKAYSFLFGKEAVPSLDKRIQAATQVAERLGLKGTSAKGASTLFILGITGLDFTPFGGADDAVKALKAAKLAGKVDDANRILKTINVADDLIPGFHTLKSADEIDGWLESVAKIQQSTKKAPKYTPVAQRQGFKSAPGEAIVPKVDSPLAREARKYKSAEEFVNSPNIEYHFSNDPNLKVGDTIKTTHQDGVFTTKTPHTWGTQLNYERGSKAPQELYITEVKNPAGKEGYGHYGHETVSPQGEVKVVGKIGNIDEMFGDAPISIGQVEGMKQSQLTDIWNKAQVKQLPTPEGLPKIKATDQRIEGISRAGDTAQQRTPIQPKTVELRTRSVDTKKATPPQQELETISLDKSLAQKSKVVNTDTPKTLAESTYEANRANLTKQKSRIAQIAESLSDVRKSIGEGADKLLGTISTRLKNIDPSLKTAIRTFEYKLAQSVQRDRRAVEGFLKKAKDISIPDYADLDLAFKNGDATKISEIIKKYGLESEYAKVRATLDDLYKRAEDVGYDIGYEKNYFPRTIKDPEGMLEYFQKGDDWSIIDEAIKAKELDLGRYLTTEEKANVVNTMVRGYPTGKVTLSETGAMKARKIDIVDAELNQFYNDSVESLVRYVDSTNEAIEARRFFGKGKKTDQFANIDDSIGSYILNLMADGKIKPSQEKELRDILQARFTEAGTSGVVRVYKNLSYIDTMGSITSAITQLGDLAFAIYKGGPINTLKSLGRAIVGKSKITRADIGIEKIAQEFESASGTARAVDRVFRLIGLNKLDGLGKETVINASISKLRQVANNPSADFVRKMELVFGDDAATIKRVTEDLKAGKTTEDVKLLAFNELLDVQPVALSEMPEQYLKGGNGRIFYMLKTYTIKLFDVYRNEVFQLMKTDPKRAIRNLLYLSGALVAMNATADEIKDLILNRKTSLKDRTVDNILKLAGFSKFTIYKAREEGIGSAVAKTILPPFKFVDSLYKDINQQNEVSQLETVQSIPIGGKLYYWWFGKGASKTAKKQAQSEPKVEKFKTPAGLPELPSLKKSLPSPPGLPKLPSL